MNKTLLTTVLLLLFFGKFFGQFSSNLAGYNPAMTGLLDQRFGHLGFGFFSVNNDLEAPYLSGFYNQSINDLNSGAGINFSYQRGSVSDLFNIGGRYQYTFKLGDEFQLAAGASLNYFNNSINGGFLHFYNYSNRDYLTLTFGTALKWRGLNAGISAGPFDLITYNDGVGLQNDPESPLAYFDLHVWYDFTVGDNFVLSPSIATFDTYSFGIRGEHSKMVYWNVRYGFERYFSFGAGVRILKNLYAGYNIGFVALGNTVLNHAFSISYRLEK